MWLFVPHMECPSVQEWEDSTSDSKSLSPDIELWCSVNGKSTLRPYSWRGWKTRPYLKLLYGTISQPSMADRGVASFMSSLRATLANPGVTPASEKDTTTSALCSMTLPELSMRFNPSLYSLRTSAEQLTFDSIARPSSKAWTTELRRDYSARLKWAHRTGGSESFSWATPDCAPDAPNRNANVKCREASLGPQAANWRTPQGQEPQINPDKLTGEDGHRKYNKETGRLAQYSVTQQAANWTSPNCFDVFTANLKSSQQTDGSKHSVNLSQEVQTWPTPASRDVKGDILDESMIRKDGKSRMDQLPCMASRFSLLDPPTSTPGEKSSTSARRLNPLFVEWLMGLPIGWSDCKPLETPWFLLLLRWRLQLYGTGYRTEGER